VSARSPDVTTRGATATDDPSAGAEAAGAPGATAGGTSATTGAGDATSTGTSAVDAPVKLPTGGTLKIGVHLSANGAAASTFGVRLPAHSPEKVDAIVKWINTHGGIAGRRVVPVYHTTDPLRGSFDQQAQDACTHLAQDEKVAFAISAAQVYRDSLPACFANNRTPLVWDVFFPTQRNVVPAQYLYRPAQPHTDRLGFVIDGLVKHGFFKDARIGIVRYDSTKAKAISDAVLKPALKKHGLSVTSEFAVREPDSAAQAGDTAAAASNGVLRFRQQRITHVVFVPSGGAIPLLYLAAAESQGYRPKYAFSSLDAPYFVRDSVPASQLRGAAGVGWGPTVDLGPEQREAQTFSSGSRLCADISKDAGYGPEESPYTYCNMLFFLKAALEGVSQTTTAALADAVTQATGFNSSLTFGARFSRGRHDGPSKARVFVWTDNWTYAGPPFAI
jgi:ABC-type branched-subunit amino acid transport system substrate-binding protein